ncbi:hydroxypyruvate isomerase family protein [Paracoccus seriniphilus]|uniref:Hydroxypyruvate isomerase n=1 Tax=Paracoccus seriniphilus TaxID=184748 RepID=A0A239PRJ2_9RHOB|nr:TIM barrel protein [Paracoccus seriniphilus]WCR12813.1 TIM barrel protein [Paracoccus seriniphilus]SNT72770.1 hydroxypyruvate isomerase [Paracoccus seriniphilus]
MPRFAANLSLMFTELPIHDRFAAAADAGFKGVELLFPYDVATDTLSRAARAAGLKIVLLNTPPPNWSGGPRGFAAVPGLEARFQSDFKRALRFAQDLQARHINIMAGESSGDEARRVFLRNLIWAAQYAPEVSLTIEPVSPALHPENFLTSYDQAAALIAEIDAPNLGLQLDSFHARMMSKDVAATFRTHQAMIRHVQIAGHPGRQEPSDKDFDLHGFLVMLDDLDYRGYVGAEYEPHGLTRAGLGWLHQALMVKDGTRSA